MDMNDLKFWAGTEESLALYLACMRAQLSGTEVLPPGAAAYHDDEPGGDDRPSRLLTKSGDIGVIKIAGPLNNTDSWMNSYRGMTGYPEIRAALVQAATDPDIGAVILDINSGGGAVSGVFDTAKLIQRVDKIKPVHSFSDGQVASAAYLLASGARSLNIGRMTEAGSVGVLTVHQEVSKMMEELGVKFTVMRAGKYKAMGNPYEPLSDAAQAEIQGQLDYMYQVFVEHVADRRKVSYDVADKKLAQGRVFVGDRALDVGLVDAITTFDELASKVQGGIDSRKAQSKYPSNFTQGTLVTKKALTEQEIAALALGGAPAADAGAPAKTAEELAAEKEAADKAAAEKEAADKAAADAHGGGSGGAPAETKPESAVVAFLRTEISAKDERIVELSMELRDEKAKSAATSETYAAMRGIAEASVGYLRVALGAAGADVKSLDDKQLLAEQAALQDTFKKKFHAGGVASTTATAPETKGDVPDPVRKARLDATRPQK